ncbi:MerR family transcriptional regulator [Streptomyces chrestomyceticus JCM 4735]|uniref:MerR family transcriptional regulator n=1 Tax=Streptomyces chrestomyceticus JCM 4735 TaxID=1306181 RepID=A0A7U9PYN5_9ACTN|nr:MerR family transcriptional regulator [Streptomyces chrestomyceticus]GCD33414.1 MerR family transcriptional regulator [Streptomyces chrestomyceticus JCM 4735]
MRIGELARATGTTTRALRYYEEQGLLRPERSANGYRSYGDEAVRSVANIRLLLACGLTTDDLRRVDGCLRDELIDAHACADPTAKAELFERRLALLQERIDDLVAVRDQLLGRLAGLRRQPAPAGTTGTAGVTGAAAGRAGCPERSYEADGAVRIASTRSTVKRSQPPARSERARSRP